MFKSYSLFYLVVTCLLLASCNGCQTNKSRKQVDVEDIAVAARIVRFDRDLLSLTEANYDQMHGYMLREYGRFFPLYLYEVMRVAHPDSLNEKQAVLGFIADPLFNRVQDSIEKYFTPNRDLEAQLTDVMKHLKYYFPQMPQPKIVFINSLFSYSQFTVDDTMLMVNGAMYLGNNNSIYDSVPELYAYMRIRFDRNYIARDAAETIFSNYFNIAADYEEGVPLLEQMVNAGRKIYFVEMMLPNAPDSLLMHYTREQADWCSKSELSIWQFLNDKDVLYKSSYDEYRRYMGNGPTTSGMPPEAPSQIGAWIGWQIVRKFMQEADDKVSLEQLLTQYDAKSILAKANYRPKK